MTTKIIKDDETLTDKIQIFLHQSYFDDLLFKQTKKYNSKFELNYKRIKKGLPCLTYENRNQDTYMFETLYTNVHLTFLNFVVPYCNSINKNFRYVQDYFTQQSQPYSCTDDNLNNLLAQLFNFIVDNDNEYCNAWSIDYDPFYTLILFGRKINYREVIQNATTISI